MKNDNLPVKTLPEEEFKGYTIDELRYQIVYKSLQREFAKERLQLKLHKLQKSLPFGGKGSPKTGGLFGSMFKSLSYLDYILMGYSAFKSVKSVFSIFRRNKRK